jgi:hypothetical protein
MDLHHLPLDERGESSLLLLLLAHSPLTEKKTFFTTRCEWNGNIINENVNKTHSFQAAELFSASIYLLC